MHEHTRKLTKTRRDGNQPPLGRHRKNASVIPLPQAEGDAVRIAHPSVGATDGVGVKRKSTHRTCRGRTPGRPVKRHRQNYV